MRRPMHGAARREDVMAPAARAVVAPREAAIVVEEASKLFLDGALVAFRQLSLAVAEQETLCIVGPSGCGKTTFLRCIAGLTELTGGRLLVRGNNVPGPPDRLAVAF